MKLKGDYLVMGSDLANGKRLLLFSSVFVVIIAIFLYIFSGLFEKKTQEGIWHEEFGKHFDLKINDKLYEDVEIEKVTFPHTVVGDELILSTVLPGDLESPSVLIFRSWHSTVEVAVDGVKLYSYGEDLFKEKRMLGSGYHLIPLTEEHESKRLTINLKVGEDESYRHITFLKICKSYDPTFHVFQPLSVPLLLDIFLIFFGALGILTCFLIMAFFKSFFASFIHISFISLCLGLWSSCNYGFFQAYTMNYELGTFLEYLALYAALYSYISIVAELKKDRGFDRIFKTEKTIYLLFLLAVCIATVLNLTHLRSFLTLFKILSGSSVLISVFIIGKDLQKQQFFERILFFGNLIFFVSLIVIFLYSFAGYDFGDIGKGYSGNSFIIISMLGLIMTFFISYALMWFNAKRYEQERKVLQKLAYNDVLTGLGNRQKAMLILFDCINNHVSYSLAIFDLNNLKTVNDIFGHAEGDKLIIDFARCLNEGFPEDYMKVRVGGDEFMVIGVNKSLEQMNRHTSAVEKRIQELNLNYGGNFILEAAFGVAASSEVESNNYEDVVELADRRMYENKRSMKSKDLKYYLNL